MIEVVQRLSMCRDMEAVMAVLGAAARKLTGADGVSVVLRDGEFCYDADDSAVAPLWKGGRDPLEACMSRWAMRHAQQVVVPDVREDERVPPDAHEPTSVRSLAMTPIRSDDPIGAIGAYWAERHEATSRELELLQALGDSASIAIANVELIGELQEANRRKDEFLAMLAHELRGPLVPLRNGLRVLDQRLEGDEQIDRSLQMMERQVGHLARIVDELLDVARFDTGRIELRQELLDLARLVREAVEDHRPRMEAAGLELVTGISDTPIWVEGDATRLAQVVDSLLDNAVKFTPPDGRVEVRLPAQGDDAVLTVSDTGVGIGAELLPHVFEAFSQADRSAARASGGLGLGLTVARGMVELHGGSIEAASEGEGQGAELTVRLPRQPEPAALGEAGRTRPSGEAPPPLRVVVVEDHHDAAESLRMLLELRGHEVIVARTGPEGVEAARAARPDVVLCDIGLPGMNGFAVAESLRGFPETAEARLIAVTGYGQDEDRRRARDAGFDAHLVKPVEPDELLAQMGEPGDRVGAG